MPGQPSFLKGVSSGSKSARPAKPIISKSSGEPPLPVRLTIPKIEAESGFLGKHSVFVVEAVAFGLQSSTKHPFEDFETLHVEISKKVPFKLPSLPRTYYWGNEEPNTVQERRGRLEEFLRQLFYQPEILSDSEETLLRFLNMHKAARAAVRFLAAPENAKAKWLQSLYETTSEPEGFLPLQDQKVEAVLLAVLQDTGIQRPRETFLVCELLARGFRSGGAPSPRRAAESQAEKPLDLLSTTAACRASEVRALLKLLQPTGPEDAAGDSKGAEESADVGVGRISPAEVRISARKALLTLACAHRGAFSATLLEFLQDPGAIPELLAVGAAAGEEGQRLVVELLVRGFDSPVVQCFADSALAGDRKRLLNQLFMSRDAFVRVTVGILLAALLCHEGYGEAAQAEAGIAAVSEELETLSPAQPLESELADLQRVLAEEDCWLWLCRLAAVRRWPAASNFALLVMLRLVQPSPEKLTETAGLHDLLVSKLADHSAPQRLRGLVARCLLDSYRAGVAPAAGPADPDLLGRALAASASEAQTLQLAALQGVAAGAEEALRRHQIVSMLEESLSQAYDSASMLGSQADAWRDCLRQASVTANAAEAGRQSASEALSSFSAQLEGACAQLPPEHLAGDGGTGGPEALRWELQHREAELIAEPLLGEGDVARAHAELDALGEERMALARCLSEQSEALQHWTSELEVSKSALARDASAAMRAAESQRQCEALQQEIHMGQEKAKQLDEQLRYATEALSAHAAAAETAPKRPMQPLPQLCDGLKVWLGVSQAQKECEEQLLQASGALRCAASELKQERRVRQQLRGVIRDLAMRLEAFDAQLEELSHHDVGMEEEEQTGAPGF